MVMMILGLFPFTLGTLPYQQLQQQLKWRLPGNSRVGQRPAYQFMGRDEETITMPGTLMPELTGGDTSLAMLELMADQGKAWPLIEGTGTIYGFYAIESLDTTRSEFFADGKAQRIDFTLTLKRIDDTLMDSLGVLTSKLLELAW